VTAARTIGQLAQQLAARHVTSEAVTDACLAAIEAHQPETNAFITVLADAAREAARRADHEVANGRSRGTLHGVPVSLKDIIDLAGTATTAGSHVRRGHVADRHAAVVERLLTAGAIIVGKTNLHEFALGPTNDDSAYGPVHHPLDARLSSGGSSGGSAVSVATGMAWASIGTDTGGSIRIPSGLCGVVGLKPSLGEVPTQGVVPLSDTLDHVGPICRSVGDARILLDVLAGRPAARSVPADPPRLTGRRLGIPRDYFLDHLHGDVARSFEGACRRAERAGATLRTVSVAHAADTGPIYVCIALAEAAEFHADTVALVPEAYTDAVRPRLQAGRYLLAEDYLRARRGRGRLVAEVNAALDGLDALLLPTVPVPAQPIGAATVRVGEWQEPVRNALLRLTQLFNVTGHPAVTVPGAPTSDCLPIGIQLVGHPNATGPLLDLAEAVEATLPGID
jgi:aspartyl-tRNA(Asn)/glutamyl-tRNA(Gln) amidotransferase subunit A